MRTETTIYSDDEKKPIATIDGALMPPVGSKILLDSRRSYVVSEPPEIHINRPDDRLGDEVIIYITVVEG